MPDNINKCVNITAEGGSYTLPLIEGSEGERAIDISTLRGKSGLTTIDYGLGNTSSTESSITFLNGEDGILRYRGYPIEELADNCSFLEVAYLLIYGELPSFDELLQFETEIKEHSLLHEDFRRYFDVWPHSAHPMGLLSAAVGGMSAFYDQEIDPLNQDHNHISTIRLLAKLPTIVAHIYKKNRGEPFMYPQEHLSYVGNLLHMMYALPTKHYLLDPEVENALTKLLILHADHEQNCSTSTVRMIGSSRANLYASVSGGVSALWGVLHGGANQAVIEMLDVILKEGGDVKKYIERAKDPKDPFRLMGFGHRVYKNYDPRAKIIKKSCETVVKRMQANDPRLQLAYEIEKVALNDEYFIKKKLYPNVDFYSGIMYKAMNIPVDMFTVFFALGRLPGWIAHWREMMVSPKSRISRPRQIYTGYKKRSYIPRERRVRSVG